MLAKVAEQLTEELAEDRGLAVERAGFETAMAEQKERARRSSFHSAAQENETEFVEFDTPGPTAFEGYENLSCAAKLCAYRVHDIAGEGDAQKVDLITDRTVFYAESGGQVGDTGTAEIGGKRLDVVDARHDGDRVVHTTVWPRGDKAGPGDVAGFLGDNRDVSLSVGVEKRLATMRNHTATHLLHAALRTVLGDHVAQAGSLVAPDRLRFDFHHFQAMTGDQVAQVERIVNDAVMADVEVRRRTMSYKEAVAAGAMALFGEKYGDSVRVVTVDDFSMELCGGTHLDRTGEIGSFLIRQESAVGAGIRRIEALSGRGALDYTKGVLDDRRRVADLLRVGPDEVTNKVRALVEESEALQRQLKKDAARRARDGAAEAVDGATQAGGVTFVATIVDAPDVASLRKYGDELRNKIGDGVALVCQDKPEKPVVLIVVSDGVIKNRSINASDITKWIADEYSFRGGGKPHMAQVGIPDKEAFAGLRDFVKIRLESLT